MKINSKILYMVTVGEPVGEGDGTFNISQTSVLRNLFGIIPEGERIDGVVDIFNADVYAKERISFWDKVQCMIRLWKSLGQYSEMKELYDKSNLNSNGNSNA